MASWESANSPRDCVVGQLSGYAYEFKWLVELLAD